jgi:hypothetical protein
MQNKGEEGKPGKRGFSGAGQAGGKGGEGGEGGKGSPPGGGGGGGAGGEGAAGEALSIKNEKRAHLFRYGFTVWIVVFTIVVAFSIRVQREQTNEIQQSRLSSCERTYSVIRELLAASIANRRLSPAGEARYQQLLAIANPEKCNVQVGVTSP